MDTVKGIECTSTLQGEGPDMGKRMLLFRFKYCNKSCPWCDTLVKMRIQQEAEFSLGPLQDIINEQKLGLLITGGEPTFQKHIDDSLKLLNYLNYPLANVESNGYHLIDLINQVTPDKKVKYIYSPKIFNENDLLKEMDVTKKLRDIKNLYIKIVFENNDLIRHYLGFLSNLDINNKVYLMPEGIDRETLIRNSPEVFDMTEKYKFNFSSRIHLIYGFI